MIKVMEHKKWWFLVSLLLLVPGIISLALWQFKPGIEFKGGSISEYKAQQSANSDQKAGEREKGITDRVKSVFDGEGIKETQIDTNQVSNSETRIYVKSAKIDSDKHSNIVRRLKEQPPPIEELSFEAVDPQVGKDVTNKAILAIIIASFVIIGYIAYSFRGVPKPTSSWQFGIFAVIALLHDVLFILGFYSFMGHFAGWEVKAEFVTAALTVMGFSVHDTIVVFDRLRENLKKFPSHSFRQVANMSVAQTIARSLNTSLTVLLVLLAIVLLGGESIRPFTLTLFVGILAGTYSSIFVATPLLDWWQDYSKRFKFKLPRLSLRKLKRQNKSLGRA
jgi:preprotein translocase subunit SecF